MFVADGRDDADFSHASEVSSNIGAAGLVTQIFCQKFFTPVGSCEARLYRHLRNGAFP